MVGGKYTYAEVPLGFWLQDAFGFARNHYDRIGHFAQGFIPAMLAREMLHPALAAAGQPLAAVRGRVLLPGVQRAVRADRVLDRAGDGRGGGGVPGNPGRLWDTQWDMQLALLGAITALVTLSRVHDRQLQRIPLRRNAPPPAPQPRVAARTILRSIPANTRRWTPQRAYQ